MFGNSNALFFILGVVITATALLAYNEYQRSKQPDGVQINVGPGGLSIEKK